MKALTPLFLLPLLAATACGGGASVAAGGVAGSKEAGPVEGGETAAEVACDPLASAPTTLGSILGVGKDPAGTIYVVDDGGIPGQPSIARVFVEVGGSLVRQDVIGSGSNGASEDIETFQSADGSTAPRDLDIQLAGATATSMTLGPEGSGKSRIEGMDAGAATPLTLVDPSTVAGLPAVDLPGAVAYVADGTDGSAIVVTEPLENDVGSAAFRLFYGPPSDLQERTIVSFEQALSGYPTFGFAVGSQTYVMAISSVTPPDGGPFELPGPVTLTGGGRSVAFTLRLPTPKTLAGFQVSCLGR
ncbi:MAG TPA: hypothetical protein VKU41_12770 [Polyangiaceae bacterium]|nr:hypothetical protein [Polyangiaceae bacterium]